MCFRIFQILPRKAKAFEAVQDSIQADASQIGTVPSISPFVPRWTMLKVKRFDCLSSLKGREDSRLESKMICARYAHTCALLVSWPGCEP